MIKKRLIIAISIITIIISLFNIFIWYKNSTKNTNLQNQLLKEIKYQKNDKTNINFSNLFNKNNETVGWLKLKNTTINYPVVQHNNNNFYLNHSFDKTYNDAGWIFMDYRNNPTEFSKNTIIYGHSRLDKTMFYTLKNVLKKSWYANKENHIIDYQTSNKKTKWQVFSTYTIPVENYYLTTNFKNEQDFIKWLNTITKRSIYNYNIKLNSKDKILTLSSCYNSNKNRVVLHAKLIEEIIN